MTDIEKKALGMINQIHKERSCLHLIDFANRKVNHKYEALCRAIEQHEAFKQEVSDAVAKWKAGSAYESELTRFIITKPDPLAEALSEIDHAALRTCECAKDLRAALAARGLKIVEVE